MKESKGVEKGTVRRNAFVVRVWQEGGRPGWQAWVQHVRSGEAVLVQNGEELLAFVEHRIGKLNSSPPRGLR